MWDRKTLKARGKAAFKKNYWPCVIVAFVLEILTTAETASGGKNTTEEIKQALGNMDLTPTVLLAILGGVLAVSAIAIVIAVLIDMFIVNPLKVGAYCFFMKNSVEEKPSAGLLFSVYKNGDFGRVFKTMFLADLYIILWTLLFVIPGIVKSYSYRMVPYLLVDHPEMSASEIITKSREMMNGQKLNAFVLDLSFILWHALSLITFGLVGVFYVSPYVEATNAELYNALKGE